MCLFPFPSCSCSGFLFIGCPDDAFLIALSRAMGFSDDWNFAQLSTETSVPLVLREVPIIALARITLLPRQPVCT